MQLVLASEMMMAEGMMQEGYATAKGIYNGVYERFGYWFRTPEAWGLDGRYRASMYMRPGAIWSMEIIGNDHETNVRVGPVQQHKASNRNGKIKRTKKINWTAAALGCARLDYSAPLKTSKLSAPSIPHR